MPDAISGIMTNQLMSIFDYAEPQVSLEIFRRFGYQGLGFLQYIRAMGKESMVSGDSWVTWEDNHIVETIKTTGVTANTGAGNDVYITLHPDSLNANNQFYAREGFIITFPENEAQGYIWNIDTTVPAAPVLQVKPPSATVDLVPLAGLPSATVLSITNGGWGHGTSQPASAQRGATSRTFYNQIFKESIGAEGSQLATANWFKKYADNGQDVSGWYSPAYLDCEYRLSLIEDGAYLFGQENTNATLVVPPGEEGAGNAITLTKGIVPHIRALGHTIAYTPGAWAITDLDQIGLYLRSQHIVTDVAAFMVGARFNNEIENTAVTYLYNTGVDYTRLVDVMFKKNNDLAAMIGFSAIKKGGVIFALKVIDNFSHPKTFGATGYSMDRYGLILPYGSVKDPKSGMKIDTFASRYRGKGTYNRKYEVWDIRGAGGGLYVTDVDKMNTYMRAHHGFQAACVNQMCMFDPA